MLARWFDRSGIGQRLAPDPNAKEVSEDDESRSTVWQYFAPDDNFVPPKAPPEGSFPPSKEQDGKVICMHCHKWTDITGGSPMIETVGAESFKASIPQTPKTPSGISNPVEGDLGARVLSACRDTSMFMKSPKLERKSHDKFLRICATTVALSKPLADKMKTMVQKNSYRDAYLLKVRATNMGVTAPDGYTALQVAAYANNIDGAKLILQLAKDYAATTGDTVTYSDLHLDRDLFGMTALHIAAERGNVEMIQVLLPLYDFPPAIDGNASRVSSASGNPISGLVDLGGQTAFGRAMTSPVPKAKKNQRKLEKNLFSKNDLSIFGSVKPNEERMGRMDSLDLHYGTADMPGLRGYMEDAMSVESWQHERKDADSAQPMMLFTVCDGHGDNGRVSEFVASKVAAVLRESMSEFEDQSAANKTLMVSSNEYWNGVWHSVCTKLDRKIKEEGLKEGGSTGVFALVTKQEIIVANVGDSRCILARKPSGENDDGKTSSQRSDASTADVPTLAEESSGTPTGTESNSNQPMSLSTANDSCATIDVIALSEDHKPNLPEEVKRIEKAGLTMKTHDIQEPDGTHTLIHKVAINEKNELAVSRAFGDFDYKANKTLGETEQAVIPIADVKVHTRIPEKDLYLVLACDGIWDVMENSQVAEFVQKQVQIKSETSSDSLLPDVADVLLNECLCRESRDNMSAIVVCLQPYKSTEGESSDLPRKALDFGSAE